MNREKVFMALTLGRPNVRFVATTKKTSRGGHPRQKKKLMTNKIAGEGWLDGDNFNLSKSNLFQFDLNESNLFKIDFVWFNFDEMICI
jgi:hypothetical protein